MSKEWTPNEGAPYPTSLVEKVLAQVAAYKPTPEWQAIFDRAQADDERRAKRRRKP